MSKAPVAATLRWQGDLLFDASSAGQRLVLDGNSVQGPSPVQTLAFSIGGCMVMDVADIVRKGRHPLRALSVTFHGERAATPPHRFTAVHLTFMVEGDVPPGAVERAIALSRERYCSVSNSLAADLALTTSFEVVP